MKRVRPRTLAAWACGALFAGAVAISCGIALFPLYWMVLTSILSPSSLYSYPPKFLPEEFRLESYDLVFDNHDLALWFLNTSLVASCSTLLSLVIGVTGGYALSRFRFHGKEAFILTVLATQMMPTVVLIIPMFRIFVVLDLRDTLTGLVLANFVFSLPVVIWMMKAVFDSIPTEIEEAARVDGASWLTILVRVTGPLALPGLAAAAIYAFIDAWDEILFARVIISSGDKWVATLGLSSFFGAYLTPVDQVMAGAVLFTIPPVLAFIFVQKYFIAGLGAGAVKG